jgi:8-oxo-dGTP pyrophosphatase MutT (NUDIX family)
MDPPKTRREGGRVVVLDPFDRVLLLYCRVAEGPLTHAWITPGGRLETGETHRQAALRELQEETGHHAESLGPCVWHRSSVRSTVDGPLASFARFYLLRAPAFDVDTSGSGPTENIEAWRWWPLAEIQAEGSNHFVPARLGELLPPLIRGELPGEPLDASDHAIPRTF